MSLSLTQLPIDTFQHRCVRDLVWVIASPPLVSGSYHQTQWWGHAACLLELENCLPTLKALDKNPQPLILHLESIKSKRLGLRFEALVSFWLMFISPNFKLLAQNIQLHETHGGETKTRTLGEMDFIIEEKSSGKVIHLEVAVKFYLGIQPFSDAYCWFGTNLNDQLGKKLDHLKQHQTQLSDKYPAQVPYTIDEKHCLIKGRLFYPMHHDKSAEGTASNHLRGRWLYYGDKSPYEALVPIMKNDWLSELSTDDLKTRDIQDSFSEDKRSKCYVALRRSATTGLKELERVFCLPPNFTFPKSCESKK